MIDGFLASILLFSHFFKKNMSVLSQNEKRYFRNEIDRLPIFRYNRMGSQENEIVLFPICTTESTLF